MTQAVETQKSEKAQEIINSIETLSVLELANLVKALEEKFGVSANAPMMMGAVAVAPGAAGAGAPVEEKTSVTIVLKSAGANKIQVIKGIRAITTLGLKEAKDLVDAAPKPIKENVAIKEAETIKKTLEAAGAAIELK
ncbi:MAG: 50S ribosomal protein L7/L12 [Candidatus Omnitrophica bacterium CG07_land_8_20_14_0_80_50_8]|nr:MAG: 50S ribosomal protein L7/L12 [Candidatus Omnitrophica bacterium CG07_land_8_20_14_0_80_50_8]